MTLRAIFGIAVATFALLRAGAIAAPPIMRGGVTPATSSPVAVSAPTRAHTTTSLDECTNHAGSFGCAFAMESHYYIVVWTWSNTTCPANTQCPPNVDGYRVYANGKLVGSVLANQGTGLALDPKQVGTPCFSVSAYKGSVESAQSDKTCVTQGNATAGMQTRTFTPLHLQSVEKTQVRGTGAWPDPLTIYKPSILEVGFKYFTRKDQLGDGASNYADRAAVLFDLRSLSGRSVQSAVLHMHVQNTLVGPDYETNTYTNCIGKVGVGQSDWWDNPSWFDGTWFATQSRSDGPDLSIDVTGRVQSWSTGRANYGFVFQGSEENLNAFTENACQSNYSTPTLEVTFISLQ